MQNKSLISVDWLQFFISLSCLPEDMRLKSFALEKRAYGSKLWRSIYKVYTIDADSVRVEFATLCCMPTSSGMADGAGSLKLHNAILYHTDWHNMLRDFVMQSGIILNNITRCDIAMDFLYLKNRISGSRLVKNILEFRWWKCGRSSYSLHAEMPYSVRWARSADDMEYSLFSDEKQKLSAFTKTLTFGRMGTAAQVCIYDKTLELRETEINGISAKEYIRDCHKAAGVWDEKRHTWRIEIRLTSRAKTIYEAATNTFREINYSDLLPNRIESTFRAAADVWFRLVDVSGYIGTELDETRLRSAILHKSRLPVVDLLPDKTVQIEFKRLQKAVKPSRFYRAMASTCERLSSDIRQHKIAATSKYDSAILYYAGLTLTNLVTEARKLEQSAAVYAPTGRANWLASDESEFKWSYESEFRKILGEHDYVEQFRRENDVRRDIHNPRLREQILWSERREPLLDAADSVLRGDQLVDKRGRHHAATLEQRVNNIINQHKQRTL